MNVLPSPNYRTYKENLWERQWITTENQNNLQKCGNSINPERLQDTNTAMTLSQSNAKMQLCFAFFAWKKKVWWESLYNNQHFVFLGELPPRVTLWQVFLANDHPNIIFCVTTDLLVSPLSWLAPCHPLVTQESWEGRRRTSTWARVPQKQP